MKTWTIEHGFYGCETGCCGYWLSPDDGNGACRDCWTFEHPESPCPTDEELSEFAKREFRHRIQPGDVVLVGDWRICQM